VPDPHTHISSLPEELPSLDPADRPLVVTHGDCPDGWCCEFLFRRHFGANADYLSARYGDPVPDVRLRPHVYIADFCYAAPDMGRIASDCGGRLTVIDHHVTAQGTLERLNLHVGRGLWESSVRVVFDLAHSGAYLTWRFLKDQGATDSVFADGNPPLIVQVVQDRDLWAWRLPDSRELNAALSSYPKTVEAWTDLHNDLTPVGGDGYWRLVREGAAILRVQEQFVQAAVAKAVEVTIAGHRVLAVNTTAHHSEVAGQLASGRPFGACFYDDLKRGLRVWSLRVRDADFDVSAIAKRFGGGGHKPSAGFNRPLSEPLKLLEDVQ
jgi:uncharacterized protein